MSNIHADPASNGSTFGEVTVTVDLTAGDCVVTAPRPGLIMPVMRTTRFHSLDEIQEAYQAQYRLAATDIARALKFAGQQLKAKQEDRKRPTACPPPGPAPCRSSPGTRNTAPGASRSRSASFVGREAKLAQKPAYSV